MYNVSFKTYLRVSVIVAMLLSLSPILFLAEQHSWLDVADKIVLVLTAIFITFFNLQFQKKVQGAGFSLIRLLTYTLLFNLLLFLLNIAGRTPVWLAIPFPKPPLFIFMAIDVVRQFIIAIVAYWIVSFFNKNAAEVAYKMRLTGLENQTLQLQLKNLTAQLQPHFFFNSLNVLAELIHIDVHKSDQYIQHLSNVFRYILSNQEISFIPLKEELNFIKSYLFLLQIRFEDLVSIDYKVQNHENYAIPALCSLVVLENIVKHNYMTNMNIQIAVSADGQVLIISNSKNMKNVKEVDSLGLGLANINEKCTLLLQKGISINESESFFEVSIPLKLNY
jgi:sensor histidine kinase YesM